MTRAEASGSLYYSEHLDIRRAEPEDMTRVGQLLVQGFPAYAYPIREGHEETDQAEAERRNATKEYLEWFANTSLSRRKGRPEYWLEYAAGVGQTVLVAELKGSGVIGYAASKQWGDNNQSLKLAELHDLQVSKGFRRQKVATRLIEAITALHVQEEEEDVVRNVVTFACYVRWAPCKPFYTNVGATMLGPLNSIKTAPASDKAIMFDTEAAALLHDNRLRQLHADVRRELLRGKINEHIGPGAKKV